MEIFLMFFMSIIILIGFINMISFWLKVGITISRKFINTESANSLATLTVKLAAKVAKSDGSVTKDKIQVFKSYFDPIFRKKNIYDLFDRSLKDSTTPTVVARQLFILCNGDQRFLILVGMGLVKIAYSERRVDIHPNTQIILSSIFKEFNFNPYTIANIYSFCAPAAEKPGINYHFSVLGIASSSSFEDCKIAYRSLMKAHHPDIAMSRGLSPDLIKRSEDLIKRINVSYEWLVNNHYRR